MSISEAVKKVLSDLGGEADTDVIKAQAFKLFPDATKDQFYKTVSSVLFQMKKRGDAENPQRGTWRVLSPELRKRVQIKARCTDEEKLQQIRAALTLEKKVGPNLIMGMISGIVNGERGRTSEESHG